MRNILQITFYSLLSLIICEVDAAFAASAISETKLCGEYTYIPPKGYVTKETILEPGDSYLVLNATPSELIEYNNISNINCIVEKKFSNIVNDFSKKNIFVKWLTKEDFSLKIAKERCDELEGFTVYLFMYGSYESKYWLSNNAVVEINDDGGFITLLALNEAGIRGETNLQIQNRMCSRAAELISTIRKR